MSSFLVFIFFDVLPALCEIFCKITFFWRSFLFMPKPPLAFVFEGWSLTKKLKRYHKKKLDLGFSCVPCCHSPDRVVETKLSHSIQRLNILWHGVKVVRLSHPSFHLVSIICSYGLWSTMVARIWRVERAFSNIDTLQIWTWFARSSHTHNLKTLK